MGESYRDIAIVGCGPAGLAAAWALAEAGAAITLYDRCPWVGGRLRTAELAGASVDVAVQLFASYYHETLRLARAAGAGDLLVRAPGRDALWRSGRARVLVYGSIGSMAASAALPAGLKLRLATRYVPYLRRHASALDVNAPVGAAASGLDRESIAAWGRRELGNEFVELLAYPQLAAYFGTTPEETTAGLYHALAWAGLAVELYAVRGGMAALAHALLRTLEQRGARFAGDCDVRAVRAEPRGAAVHWDGGSARHDAAVLAVPGAAVAGITELGDTLRDWFAGVRSVPAASLALVLDRAPAPDYFGLSVPRGEPPGDLVAAVCNQGRKAAGLPGGNRGAIVVYPAPAAVPRILEGSSDEAISLLLPAVEKVIPGLTRRVVHAQLFRFHDGGALFYPGYLRHLARFDSGSLSPRLALAGDYLVAPTVEGAVRSGLRAARRLLSH